MAALSLLLQGCATQGHSTTDTGYQTTLGKVAVVATALEPEIRFEALGQGESAAFGASYSLLLCLQAAHGTGFAGAPILLFNLGYCALAAAAGGVAGAALVPSAESVQAARTQLSSAVVTQTIQESLRKQVVVAMRAHGTKLVDVDMIGLPSTPTRNYRALSGLGADTVLETELTRVGTLGVGMHRLTLFLQARVRAIRTIDNVQLFATDYVHLGKRLGLAEWVADEGKELLQALEAAHEVMGAHIHDSVFLLYRFPDQAPGLLGNLFPTTFGLAPILPVTNFGATGERLEKFHFLFTDKLRPTFQWERFPREADLKRAPEEMARAKNITYDLVLTRESDLFPTEAVYRREGLTENTHDLETPLMPDTRYFWTVRARFELDGRRRVTEWGSYRYEASDRFTSPSYFSYRFMTERILNE